MEEEKIPESKKFQNEKPDKDHHINMALISETSMQSTATPLSEEEKINVIIRLQSIHLEWLNIRKIQNLEVFEHLTVLYLQHVLHKLRQNRIDRIQGLSHLKNLEYLALNDNRISTVENLKELKRLQGLHLSNNNIEDFEDEELPENLQYLSMKGNPVCMDVDYKRKILKKLKALESLDDVSITPAERFKIIGIFPQKLVDYANQMRQFYTKRELKSKIQEESRPVLFNTQAIDEKQALGELREKTRKYIYQNQESFKAETKEQIADFTQKIEVSKKIRSIKEGEEKERQRRLADIRQSTISQLRQNYQ